MSITLCFTARYISLCREAYIESKVIIIFIIIGLNLGLFCLIDAVKSERTDGFVEGDSTFSALRSLYISVCIHECL